MKRRISLILDILISCKHFDLNFHSKRGNKEIDEIGLYNEIETMGMYFGPLNLNKQGNGKLTKFSKPVILEEWEDINVNIPSKRNHMRGHFIEIIKE